MGLEPTFPSCSAVVLPVERPNHLFLYLYCITNLSICQYLFLIFLQGGGCALTIACGSLSALDVGCSLTPAHLVPLLYHTLRGLSRGFLHFFSISSDYSPRSRTAWRLYPSPLDTYYYSRLSANCKMAKYTKSGFFTHQCLCSLSIDKLAGRVYNRNSALDARHRADNYST